MHDSWQPCAQVVPVETAEINKFHFQAQAPPPIKHGTKHPGHSSSVTLMLSQLPRNRSPFANLVAFSVEFGGAEKVWLRSKSKANYRSGHWWVLTYVIWANTFIFEQVYTPRPFSAKLRIAVKINTPKSLAKSESSTFYLFNPYILLRVFV